MSVLAQHLPKDARFTLSGRTFKVVHTVHDDPDGFMDFEDVETGEIGWFHAPAQVEVATAYTMRVFRLTSGAHEATDQQEQFTADSDDTAIERMNAYAAESVASGLLVHLYRDGETRSFASAEGLLR